MTGMLLDTQLLLWAANKPELLSRSARAVILDPGNELFFSSVSIWEVAIKQPLRRSGFDADAGLLLARLRGAGYRELEMTCAHVVRIRELALLHGDPFDRILIAQAMCEGLTLLTADSVVAGYPGPILKV
jgi:PIN domain nuclease of toxin-antitoxin system